MSYEQPYCLYCRDTGKKLTGEVHSDYLDCGHCGAAQERGDMEVYANNLITINRLQPADYGLLWAVHERARDIAYAEIVRLSKERNQAEARIVSSTDAFKRIAQAHHAALVAGNGDTGEIAKLANYLNPAAVSHETWRARAVELETMLFSTLELLENTDGISKNNIDNLAGEKAEEIRKVLYLPAAAASTAVQAPVREVPNERLQNWIDVIHDNERSMGDRLQSLSSTFAGLLRGDAVDKYPMRAIREQLNWLPIDTAPKDGTSILIVMQGYTPSVARWIAGYWMTADMEADYEDGELDLQASAEWGLTHWMPLPAAPVQEPKP